MREIKTTAWYEEKTPTHGKTLRERLAPGRAPPSFMPQRNSHACPIKGLLTCTKTVQGQIIRIAAYAAAQAAKRAAAEEQARCEMREAARAHPTAPPNATPRLPQPGGPVPDPADPAPPVTGVASTEPEPEAPAPPPVVVPSLPGGAVNDPAGAKSYASGRLGSFGWGQDQFLCLAQLWTKESNWMTTATNPYSGAYGIPQALPPGKYSSAGSDWLTSYRTQIEWGLGYIRDRYGSPCRAWSHSVAVGWY